LNQNGPSQAQKFDQKYWAIGIEKRDNIPKFELKFKEDKCC
jgi:hypothetical protein